MPPSLSPAPTTAGLHTGSIHASAYESFDRSIRSELEHSIAVTAGKKISDDPKCLYIFAMLHLFNDVSVRGRLHVSTSITSARKEHRRRSDLQRSGCCEKKFCWLFINTQLSVQARINNCSNTLKELIAWTASQLESFDTGNSVFAYRIRGKPVCKEMWMRFYALGKRTVQRAHKLYRNNKTLYSSSTRLSGRVCQDCLLAPL
eukprot:g19808.t1